MTINSNDPDEPELAVSLSGTGLNFAADMGTGFWFFTSNTESEKIIAFRNFVDLNNDGKNEILVADNDYNIHCINGNSSGEADIFWSFSTARGTYWTGSIYQEPGLKVTGDLNADGIPDVIAGTAWGSRSVFAIDGSNGELIWYFDSHTVGDGGWVYEVDGFRDYNNDGINDVLACAGDDAYGTGPKRVWLFDGTDGSLIWQHLFGVAIASVISLQDATGDGIPEVVCGESANSGTASVYLLNGSNGSTIYSWDSGSSAVMSLTAIQDANNDGLEDFCYGDFQGDFVAYSSSNQFLWYASTGSGLITHLNKFQSGTDEFLLPGILGNNSFPLINTSDGVMAWNINTGAYTLDSAPASDLNGDGTVDVLLGSYDGGGVNNALQLLSGTDGQLIYSVTPGSPVEQVEAIDDLDGNGSAEIIYGLRNGTVYCISGGTDGTQSNDPPQIISYHTLPHYPNSGDQVHIGASITDDAAVVGVKCQWGHDDNQLNNSIVMAYTGQDQLYQTVTPIPAQPAGTSIYYQVNAWDVSDTTHSYVDFYSVYDPPAVIINEIMYNSIEVNDNDWIELYNYGDVTVDMTGFELKTVALDNSIIMPNGSEIAPGEFFTVAIAIGAPPLPFTPDLDGTGYFTLVDQSSTVGLYLVSGVPVSEVSYDVGTPWPDAANGNGPSLELISPDLDISLPASWQASFITGGTPGYLNSDSSSVDIDDNDPLLPGEITLYQNYPNPFNPTTTVSFALPMPAEIKISVFDLQGRLVEVLINKNLEAGYQSVTFNGSRLATGIYFYRLTAGEFSQTRKMVIVK